MDEIAFRRNDDNVIVPQGQPGQPLQTTASTPGANDPYPWILHPVIDLLFACGGLFWIIFGVFLVSGVKPDLFGGPTA